MTAPFQEGLDAGSIMLYLPVVEFLRALGHDVLTVQEATQNRQDFFRFHRIQPEHAGIFLAE